MIQLPARIQYSIDKTRQTSKAINETLWASIYWMDMLEKQSNSEREVNEIKRKLEIIVSKHPELTTVWLGNKDNEEVKKYLDSLNKQELSPEIKKELYIFFSNIHDNIMKNAFPVS